MVGILAIIMLAAVAISVTWLLYVTFGAVY
jgi:hypothetical protein